MRSQWAVATCPFNYLIIRDQGGHACCESSAITTQASEPASKAEAGRPTSASELLAIAEKLCERTAGKREGGGATDCKWEAGPPTRQRKGGPSVDMSVVMRRVAMARAEIADRDRLAKVALLRLSMHAAD